jgi:hypothetical protein
MHETRPQEYLQESMRRAEWIGCVMASTDKRRCQIAWGEGPECITSVSVRY